MHGLFIMGPLILGAYWVDRVTTPDTRRRGGGEAGTTDRSRHAIAATAAVAAACLVNPYGLRGVLFPLEILPKIAPWGGVYRTSIVEYMSLQASIERFGVSVMASNLYYRCALFLMGALPLSFLIPAMERYIRRHARHRATLASSLGPGAGLGLALLCIGAVVLSLPTATVPNWLAQLTCIAPLALAALGVTGALLLVPVSGSAALLTLLGGIAEAAWVFWLRAYLFDLQPAAIPGSLAGPMHWAGTSSLSSVGRLAAGCGMAAAFLTLRSGGRQQVFRLLLAVAFTYLALQAVRNISLFALIAGYVLTCNLGEWAAGSVPVDRACATASAPAPPGRASLVLDSALCGFAVFFLWAIVTDRFSRITGESRHFGVFASPLAYAHDAARFAGQPGLPKRALAFSLRQAGVYTFHNCPPNTLFMDCQNEVHPREVFETYMRVDESLIQGREDWESTVRAMGNPLILLDHIKSAGAEATLLLHPGWRCIFYDAVGSVFIARTQDVPGAAFPSINFAARHFGFTGQDGRKAPFEPWGLGEARALYRLRSALRARPESSWPLRFSLMLLACDRLRNGMAAEPQARDPVLWGLLGNCYRGMVPNLTTPPAGPAEPWDRTSGLLLAQAAYCYRRALMLNPGEPEALSALTFLLRDRRMDDALPSPATPSGPAPVASLVDPTDRVRMDRDVTRLLQSGRTEAATRMFRLAEARGAEPSWPCRDAVALALLHLGRPAEASGVWERGNDAPSAALRLARIATADLTGLDFDAAIHGYQQTLELDPASVDARFGLALAQTEVGRADKAVDAARRCRQLSINASEAAFLRVIESLARPPVPSPP